MLRFVLPLGGDDAHAEHTGTRFDFALRRCGHGAVHFHDGVGARAATGAVHARGGDVHAGVGQAACDVREHAALVFLADYHAGALARHVHVHAIDAPDGRRASANAHAAHVDFGALGVDDVHVNRVGMVGTCRFGLRVGCARERELESGPLRQKERIADAQVVGFHAHQACHQGFVGAVPGARVRKRSVQHDIGAHGGRRQQAPRHARDAQRAGGVRAGGPHHDGSDDVVQAKGFHKAAFPGKRAPDVRGAAFARAIGSRCNCSNDVPRWGRCSCQCKWYRNARAFRPVVWGVRRCVGRFTLAHSRLKLYFRVTRAWRVLFAFALPGRSAFRWGIFRLERLWKGPDAWRKPSSS